MRRPLFVLALAMVLPLPALAAQVTVKPGETLSDIAARHRVSVSTLMKVNGISDPDLVEAGRTLTLPGGAVRPRTAGGNLTVAPGETLSEIADRHGITVSRLMQLNGLSKADHIEAGQNLVVPSSSRGASPASGFNRKASEHVVRSGESLSQIADGYGVPMQQLIAINRISNPNFVESGTRLRLRPAAAPSVKPAARPAAAAKPTPATKPAAKPAPAAAKPAARPTPTSQPAPTVARATPAPAAKPQPAVVAAAPRPATTASPGKPDWRNYGPLQVDWANWQPMGGSMVAPTLNSQGESLYLAVNCSARKLNATSQAGQWKSWDDPQADFEQQLVADLCKSRGS
ncbi:MULTISPECIES: LysM peptidoglycan-binding domain-containing protein [unclassified Cyanobium]|uniref:lytic transglycosylase n=1 Tax=unclassified Cyanobium TaxID=2627006 RepID=UPI0020CDF5B7|nr:MULTISPECIES: LysM peptidoglycan-binding domain-containing protein [unclassified Cyanobium]MCP9860443.1 LysM peptidoglycan-binding domain-containing protein [Cyanobium sp. Cruz-8H5]MCP9867504.1 LysM peptidoglycan-binding domain-containing protein [Cyanobium sp. Cruz-8D1]